MNSAIEHLGWNPDLVYEIGGGVLAILLTLVFFLFYWWGTRYQDGHSVGGSNAVPQLPEEPIETSADRAMRPSSAATDLAGAEAPADDVPDDLLARVPGGLQPDPSTPPHAASEIPLPTARPLSSALSNTRNSFFGRIRSLFGGKPALNAGEMEELEEILYTSDLGPQTVQRLLEAVEEKAKSEGGGIDAVRNALRQEMLDIFATSGSTPKLTSVPTGVDASGAGAVSQPALHIVRDGEAAHSESERYISGLELLNVWEHKPSVLMVVGVNGAGKTTTIGKLSSRLAQSGKKVLVAAGDTFRAAAGHQLKVWTERARVEIFSPDGVTDPSAVGYAACERGRSEGFDVVIIDTAGRLHTQKNLMEELRKMKRVIEKLIPGAPHEILLVLDANSGQNALIQAREFHQALGVTGVALTKLDGSAKGGVAVGLAFELKIPIKLIGVGEGIEDLRKFSSEEFVDSIL